MIYHEVPPPFGCCGSCRNVCWRTDRLESLANTVSLIEHAETDTTTDTGKAGDFVGDILTFANKVFDDKNDKQVGTDNGFCLRTVVGQAYECNWTAFLADGQITAEGPFYDTKDSILTVTGGTGAYDGMHGQLKLHARDAKGSEYDFVYEISK